MTLTGKFFFEFSNETIQFQFQDKNAEKNFLNRDVDGKVGSGKSMSLSHVVHRCSKQGMLVIHLQSSK